MRALITVSALVGLLIGCEESPAPFMPVSFDRTGVQSPPVVDVVPKRCLDPSALTPGKTLPRRLSNDEYSNTVVDLLGVDAFGDVTFPPEERALGFNNNARALQATPLHAERYMYAAEAAADLVIEQLDDFLACYSGEPDDACVERFLTDMGSRAWRRPLTPVEVDALMALYRAQTADGDGTPDAGVRTAVTALLQSPSFLYRIEVGVPVDGEMDLFALDSYEVASRLSYFLWRTMPDAELFIAAETGALLTESGLSTQVDRMLAHPKARAGFWQFFAQWLHLEDVDKLVKDPRYYPDFNAMVAARMKGDARAFIEDAVWSAGGSMRALFDREFTVAGDPDSVVRVGVLSQPALLAATSKPNMTSPIHRGIFVREQLLCTALPPPPPDLMVVAPDPDPNLTTRQLFEAHSAEPACAGCHQLIDPLGLGFEHFDAVGNWRDVQNGRQVDAKGEVFATTDINGAFYGLDELAGRLSRSDQVHRCVTTQVFRYAMGRGENAGDGCTIESVYEDYVDSGYDFRTLVKSLATHLAFRHKNGGAHD
ncbi:MAG: DUF1592 domain-containing protein [Bradymonadia bacterium]